MNETWWVTEEDLDEDQQEVIELPPDGNYVITGPPGSGKTNLVLLRAKFLSLAGHPNLAVVVLTRSLRDFIASGAARYALAPEAVVTSVRFYIDFLREHGVSIEESSDFERHRAALIERVQAVVEERGIENIYDAILLDEAQDFLASEISLFARLSVRFFAVADARQTIYKTSNAIKALFGAGKHRKIRHHYRNGIAICRLADAIAKEDVGYEPLENHAAYDEAARPSSVEVVPAGNDETQAKVIVEKLALQMKAYPDELLGVVVPLREDADRLYELLRAAGLGDVLHYGADESLFAPASRSVVILSTIHGAKGLEYRAVHLANGEGLKKFPNSRNLAFTAVTRAKTSLSIHHTRALPPFLQGAIAKIQPLPQVPRVQDVFGRRQ